MGKYIPKINLPLEGVEHARWLERRSLKAGDDIDELFRLMRALGQSNASAARRPSSTIRETAGDVPLPSLTGSVLRGGGAAGQVPSLSWTYEWQGLMPEYWVSLDPAGASYYVSGMAGQDDIDELQAKALLPSVEFSDGGLTMLPITMGNFADSPSGGLGGQTPIHLYVDVNPSFDGEEFTIYVPSFDNFQGVTTPFYTFDLTNVSSFSASVQIQDSYLFYEGTLTPVLGSLGPWTVAAGDQYAWFVRNVKGWGATAAPTVFWDGATASFTDAYYETNVYVP